MFDIVGKVNWTGSPLEHLGDPFDAIVHYEKIDCVKKSYISREAEVNCLFKGDDFSDVCVTDRVAIYLYGYCFFKIRELAGNQRKKLNARDVLDLYQDGADTFIDRIKGSFSIIVTDFDHKFVRIYTDSFNLRTIYYSYKEGQLLFSSSLNALVKIFNSKRWATDLDCFTLAQYYLFDYALIDEDSFVKGIKTVPPGCCLLYERSELKVSEYWNVFRHYSDLSPEYSEEDGVKYIEDVMYKNIEMYKGSPDDTAVALTGGYDSRTLISLLRQSTRDYEYYSYGKCKESWDLKVPRIIAKKLDLKYTTFYLDERFSKSYNENAEISIVLGDGVAESSRSNYSYVYSSFFENKKNILTGLFGSELIKAPTSQGSFWDKNMKSLLQADNVKDALNKIIDDGIEKNMLMGQILNDNRQRMHDMVASMPYFDMSKTVQERYFYFLLMVGIRKYFMKEIKVERPFVTNYHPYFDIEFVDALMKTPFSWYYNWDEKKNLIKSLKSHRLYGYLIQRNNPKLANIITTHAYKPKYLMNNLYLPMLAAEYFYYKGKLESSSGLNFDDLIYQFGDAYFNVIQDYNKVFNNTVIFENKMSDMKNFNKLVSFQVWMHLNGINV